VLLDESSKARFDTLITAAIHNNKTLSQAASRFLHISHLLLPLRGVWIYKQGDQAVFRSRWSTLDAELNDFSAQLAMLGGHAADSDR
jgi:hypothetical protein